MAVTLIFILNALFLWFISSYHAAEIHASVAYPLYLSFRSLILKPMTLIFVVVCVIICSLMLRYRTRVHPPTFLAKAAVLAIGLAAIYGFILLLLFRL